MDPPQTGLGAREDDADSTSDRPRRVPPSIARRVLLIGLLGVGGVLALFAGGVAFFILSAEEMPVTDADRSVIVDVQRLATAMDDFKPAAGAGNYTKTRYVDGSYELDYEYEHPDDATPLYLSCSVSVEPTGSDARAAYAVIEFGLGVELKLEGGEMTQEAADHLFRWGDQSTCTILKSEGEPVGNFLIVRTGRRVLALTITGVYFEDSERFASLVVPVLERLKSYAP